METFNPGDIVRLKSGGPHMTVDKEGDLAKLIFGERVFCKWFVEGKLHSDSFSAESLVRVPEDEQKAQAPSKTSRRSKPDDPR